MDVIFDLLFRFINQLWDFNAVLRVEAGVSLQVERNVFNLEKTTDNESHQPNNNFRLTSCDENSQTFKRYLFIVPIYSLYILNYGPVRVFPQMTSYPAKIVENHNWFSYNLYAFLSDNFPIKHSVIRGYNGGVKNVCVCENLQVMSTS